MESAPLEHSRTQIYSPELNNNKQTNQHTYTLLGWLPLSFGACSSFSLLPSARDPQSVCLICLLPHQSPLYTPISKPQGLFFFQSENRVRPALDRAISLTQEGRLNSEPKLGMKPVDIPAATSTASYKSLCSVCLAKGAADLTETYNACRQQPYPSL